MRNHKSRHRPLPTRATDEKGTRRYDDTRLQAPRHHHVFAALNVLEGTVIAIRAIVTPNTCAFCARPPHPKGTRDRHPRFHAHFIPTSSSWQPRGAFLSRDPSDASAAAFSEACVNSPKPSTTSPTLQRQPETLRMDKNRRPNSQQTRADLCQSGIIGLNWQYTSYLAQIPQHVPSHLVRSKPTLALQPSIPCLPMAIEFHSCLTQRMVAFRPARVLVPTRDSYAEPA